MVVLAVFDVDDASCLDVQLRFTHARSLRY